MSAATKIFAGLLGIVLGAGLAWGDNEVGDTATDFTLPDGNGVDHSLYNYTGDVIALTFWDPW